MKKILFITAGFAPWGGPISMRATKLASAALSRGLDVSVLTTSTACRHVFDDLALLEEVKGAKITRVSDGTDYMGRNTLAQLLGYQPMRVLDRVFGKSPQSWSRDCVKAGLAMEKPDLIFATSPRPEVIWIASQLSKQLECPYIMDFRDPPWEMKMSSEEFESYLNECTLAVLNTPPAAEKVCSDYPQYEEKVECWTNGVDRPNEELLHVENTLSTKSIVYGGGIYPHVVKAISRLQPMLSPSSDLNFDVYGFVESKRAGEIAKIKEMGANFHGAIPNKQMVKIMSQAWANLVSSMPEYQMSSKVYLTIASGRPVIIYGKTKSSKALLSELPGVYHFDDSSTVEELTTIRDAVDEYDAQAGWQKRYAWLSERSWPAIFEGIFNKFIDQSQS